MSKDPHREAIDLSNLRTAVHALLREDAVVEYYRSKHYKVVAASDAETRSVFKIPATRKYKQQAVDVVVEVSSERAIMAEVKGSDLDKALSQLRNSVIYVKKVYPFVESKIFVNREAPEGNSDDLKGGTMGYKVIRVFNHNFPAEWLLAEYQQGGGTEFCRIDGLVVSVIFGPLIPRPV